MSSLGSPELELMKQATWKCHGTDKAALTEACVLQPEGPTAEGAAQQAVMPLL